MNAFGSGTRGSSGEIKTRQIGKLVDFVKESIELLHYIALFRHTYDTLKDIRMRGRWRWGQRGRRTAGLKQLTLVRRREDADKDDRTNMDRFK